MKQVNISVNIDGVATPWISNWNEDGYVGRLVDTQYADGCSYTEWCVYTGSQEECEQYINDVDWSSI